MKPALRKEIRLFKRYMAERNCPLNKSMCVRLRQLVRKIEAIK